MRCQRQEGGRSADGCALLKRYVTETREMVDQVVNTWCFVEVYQCRLCSRQSERSLRLSRNRLKERNDLLTHTR